MSKGSKRRKAIAQANRDWYVENYPVGISLGYPKCCVEEFCKKVPGSFKVTDDDVMRSKAAIINGNYSGFIPCTKHARQILSGEIKPSDLIKDRSEAFKPFPDEWGTI